MVYLYYGFENFLIEKEISNRWKQEQLDSISINFYDMETSSLKEILEDAQTTSLFSLKKGILCENASFFSTSSMKDMEQDIELLEQYLDHPNPDTILIFVTNSDKLDERKRIVKKIKKVGVVKEFQKEEKKSPMFVQSMFDGYEISREDLSFFQNRVGNDLFLLEQEAEKLKLYKIEEKRITREDILCLTSKNIDLDIFPFIDYIVSKNKEKAMEIYQEMLKRNEEPIKIIVLLANQFRIMYQSKLLLKKGYTEKDIASTLGIHPYRIKLALQKGRSFSETLLLNYLNQLSELDYQIKSNQVSKDLALELFILGL